MAVSLARVTLHLDNGLGKYKASSWQVLLGNGFGVRFGRHRGLDDLAQLDGLAVLSSPARTGADGMADGGLLGNVVISLSMCQSVKEGGGMSQIQISSGCRVFSSPSIRSTPVQFNQSYQSDLHFPHLLLTCRLHHDFFQDLRNGSLELRCYS